MTQVEHARGDQLAYPEQRRGSAHLDLAETGDAKVFQRAEHPRWCHREQMLQIARGTQGSRLDALVEPRHLPH